jgi:HSP20 family protein
MEKRGSDDRPTRHGRSCRTWGRFEQVISLPEAVNTDDVQAELINGVLRVTLPKTPEARPKKITLKTS